MDLLFFGTLEDKCIRRCSRGHQKQANSAKMRANCVVKTKHSNRITLIIVNFSIA